MAYQEISEIFYKNDSDLSPSEAHGLATGMLCLESTIDVINWLTELFPEEIQLVEEDRAILCALFEQTRTLLNNEDNGFRFDLFLPDEEDLLKDQANAIKSWCEGFLFGIGYIRSTSAWTGEIGEILKDIVEFTKMETELDDEMETEDLDEYETALIEIQEYLRVSVMMIKEKFEDEHANKSH